MTSILKGILATCILLIFSIGAYAQTTKVVVIPLGGLEDDPNLVPENICHGVTIFGITGTTNCTPTVTSAGGRVWLDRNLGASQVATSQTDILAYGDLYQWGRGADGHENRTSPTTTVLSPSDSPGHDDFILATSSPYDWRTPQNGSLWQGTAGINNPCPAGFRLPTETEWETERGSWGSNNSTGAFASPLKLVVAGYRDRFNGTIGSAGSFGLYWSSTVNGSYSRYLSFSSGNAYMGSNDRATGFSVRCLKD